jgi:hypothetical protein
MGNRQFGSNGRSSRRVRVGDAQVQLAFGYRLEQGRRHGPMHSFVHTVFVEAGIVSLVLAFFAKRPSTSFLPTPRVTEFGPEKRKFEFAEQGPTLICSDLVLTSTRSRNGP